MHALSVSLLRAKQLPVITNGLGASPHAGSTCTIGVVTVRPLNRLPARLYFKIKPDPNNTFFFIFTCTTQYPWVLANLSLSQAMAPSKKKRTHTVFRDSSAHRSASTSKPRFAGERVKLGDVCTIVSGATPKTKTNEYWGGEIRWVTPAELDGDSHYISDTEKHLTEAGYKSTSLRMMPKGTVLLTTRAPIGKVAIAAEEMSCNQGFKNLVCSSAINNEFLYLYLKSRTAELQAMGRGATFKELSKKNVAGFEINLPAIDRQLDAVAKLTAVRSQIALAKQQHDQLDSLVKSRFVEMFLNSSWPIATIGECSMDIHYGTSEKASTEGEYVYLRMNNMGDDGSLDLSDIKRITLEGKALSNCLVRKGDLLFNRTNSREKVGKTCVFCLDEPMVIAGYIIRVRLDDRVDSTYLAAYMNLSSTKALLRGMAKGAVHQANINAKQLASIEFPLADIKAQKEFVSFVSQVDKSRFVRDHEINFRWERFTLSWSTIA